MKIQMSKAVAGSAAVLLLAGLSQAVPALASDASPAGSAGWHPLTAAQATALSGNATDPVIVLLKDQPATRPGMSAAIRSSQPALLSELGQVHARRMIPYHLANAVAATVSPGEAARLASDPAVAKVIPDGQVKGPGYGQPPVPARPAKASTATASGPAGTCPAKGKVMLEPEALPVTRTQSQDPRAATARSLGFTGKGVTVAFIADGIDIHNPDFTRGGKTIFADYRDFSGDGTDQVTSGDEAFLDASAIAAQGNKVYDVSHFSASSLSSPCDIRIKGTAPGARLVGLKVYGAADVTTQSSFLAAIDYAVHHDHVNVLNESFGSNPFPSVAALDATELFNDMAVRAGVTVTVSTGDAGTTSTIGSPASDPNVISVGGTTTFRFYEQTDYAAARAFHTTGWLNDNITPLSSGGYTADGHTLSLVAPGDSSFAACSANTAQYAGCVNFTGAPSRVEHSGGTSESAPLTAGVAALVIQAYRQAHGGATPSPARVKQILTSTADDLGVPAYEQGAGRLDAYRAVLAALSVHSAHPRGATLLVGGGQLTATGLPGTAKQWRVLVTNNGASAQSVRVSGRSFGPSRQVASTSVTLSDDTSPHFTDAQGVPSNYGKVSFTVPAGAARLDAEIAYNYVRTTFATNPRVRLILIDPRGRFAAHSIPQGVGNYGHVDVRFPAAGKWTAIIFSPTRIAGGTFGAVPFAASVARTTGFGSVSPAVLRLKPGQTGTVTVRAHTPAAPGDSSASIVFAGAGRATSVPVTLRSLVPANGTFSGTLTGGNGRPPGVAQANYYQFNVPQGVHDVTANVGLSSDTSDLVQAYLIDPHGQLAGYGTNYLASGFSQDSGWSYTPGAQASLFSDQPAPGRWTLAIEFTGTIAGDELSQQFTGSVQFNAVQVSAPALPHGDTLTSGVPVTVPVTIRNTGSAAEDFFVDPRLSSVTTMKLTGLDPTADIPLPMNGSASTPAWEVPSHTSSVDVTATATVPVMFDSGLWTGDPDLASHPTGPKSAEVRFSAPSVAAGLWYANPAELAPNGFPRGGASPGKASLSTTVRSRAFDPSITSDSGDFYQVSVDPTTQFSLITVQPGETATINVTITPHGAAGAKVSGDLFVDDIAPAYAGGVFPAADELGGLPYSYTVG